MVYFVQIHSNLWYGILMWGNMIQQSDLIRLQKIQNRCVQSIQPNMQVKDIYREHRILPIREMLKLENCKLWYKYYQKTLPTKLQKIMSIGPCRETLIKGHKYNTHRKGELNSPKAMSQGYRKSCLSRGLCDFSSLPQQIKNSKTFKQFVNQCKGYLLKQ